MDRDSTKKLRLDRRLIRRRGWISDQELRKELEALPDVAHKIAPAEAERTEPPAAAAPPSGDAPADPDPEAPNTLQ